MIFGNGNSVEYEYTTDGVKLRTVHKTGSTTLTTDYCGNAVYENGVLKMLLNEAGYVSFPDRKYHFYLKDHQGNIRVVADKDGNVEETNSYYPFGGMFTSTANVQPYKYNGKELDLKNGLNWYDYGARHYDAALGRWHVVDPMSEKFYSCNSYVYCNNNPVLYKDPDGRWIVNAISAIVNAGIDYGSQVAANLATGKTGLDAFTDDISLGSIVVSAVEGAINPIGAITKNIAKTTVKTVVKTTLKEAGKSATGKMIDNTIKGENILKDVGTEAVVGGITGNLKVNPSNNNANTTINKMKNKVDKGKTLTHQQGKMLDTAKSEKVANVGIEITTSSISATVDDVITKRLKDEDKNK